MRDLGYVNRVLSALSIRGLICEVFDTILPGPVRVSRIAEECSKQMSLFRPDSIVALGGGSVLDSAKVLHRVTLLLHDIQLND